MFTFGGIYVHLNFRKLSDGIEYFIHRFNHFMFVLIYEKNF